MVQQLVMEQSEVQLRAAAAAPSRAARQQLHTVHTPAAPGWQGKASPRLLQLPAGQHNKK